MEKNDIICFVCDKYFPINLLQNHVNKCKVIYEQQNKVHLIMPEEYKILYIPGVSTSNLTQQERDLYKQNTGCFINTVYKNSSAFYVNLCYGDIIIAINGKKIFDDDDYMEFVRNSNYGDIWNMTIVRNGFEKEISLIFD